MLTHEKIKKYYNEVYYDKDNPNRPTAHYHIYLDHLGITLRDEGKRILDIACGDGNLLSCASERKLVCSGMDISEKAIEMAKTKLADGEFQIGKAESLAWNDSEFDFVTCLGSLEHFLDMDKAISEMIRVAKESARILIMVPNLHFPNWDGTDQQQIKETLLSLEDWKQVLQKNKLVISNVYADKWPAKWIRLSKRNPIKLVKGLHAKYKIVSLPLAKSYQFIFVCASATETAGTGPLKNNFHSS